ncbi:MAG: UDP-N-acetylmuramoyl-L-alanyl-D-glutamate--2,6-diaminopimelate ligase [Arenicella sp.]|nr:UDP-N-acetylmuramoyl-L-alanyl-D-glutamate--2,6-diaminopimelate ligase [Arenicella sp.]
MNYSMPLDQLIAGLAQAPVTDVLISDLAIDSRAVTEGALFIACPGGSTDGRDFIEAAQQAGAAAVLYEADGYEVPDSVTMPAFAVADLQSKAGYLADRFFGQPSSELQVFGVTGTNGKTTSCYLLTQAFTELGMKAAMIGTIGAGTLEQLSSSSLTTPDAIALHRLLAEMRDKAITQVCMEVSSHALEQGRVNGVQFFCTLFTNLSQDHLDYHGDMRSYAAAKQRLFTEFHSELVITNADDETGAALIDLANANFIASYSEQSGHGDVSLQQAELRADGMRLLVEANETDIDLTTRLIGKVNIPNVLMLVASLLALSTPVEQIRQIVATLQPAPGRMELHKVAGKPSVVVDYAHTPDALRKALDSLQQHCNGQLWCVFGCGGDRDAGKRPMMGAAADQLADVVVVTNDNPRSESPQQIAEQICAGIKGECRVELDRAAAIRTAITLAAADDWVLVAGKGHETTQTVGDRILPFSDRQQVIENLGAAA